MLGAQKMQQRSHINAKTQHTHNVEKIQKIPLWRSENKTACMQKEF